MALNKQTRRIFELRKQLADVASAIDFEEQIVKHHQLCHSGLRLKERELTAALRAAGG